MARKQFVGRGRRACGGNSDNTEASVGRVAVASAREQHAPPHELRAAPTRPEAEAKAAFIVPRPAHGAVGAVVGVAPRPAA